MLGSVLKTIPGFRSGRKWKQVVASVIYGLALVLSLAGPWSIGLGVVVAAITPEPTKNPLAGVDSAWAANDWEKVMGLLGALRQSAPDATDYAGMPTSHA